MSGKYPSLRGENHVDNFQMRNTTPAMSLLGRPFLPRSTSALVRITIASSDAAIRRGHPALVANPSLWKNESVAGRIAGNEAFPKMASYVIESGRFVAAEFLLELLDAEEQLVDVTLATHQPGVHR